MSITDHTSPLMPIFGLKHKSELSDYCAGLELSNRDLLEIVLCGRAGEFEPYNYACHVLDAVPDELGLGTDDLLVLSRTGQGLMPRDQRLIERAFLTPGYKQGLRCGFQQQKRQMTRLDAKILSADATEPNARAMCRQCRGNRLLAPHQSANEPLSNSRA